MTCHLGCEFLCCHYVDYIHSDLFCSYFRDECEKIRHTLLTQQREESDAALNQLMTLKEKELDAYKKELQQQISRYQQQVSFSLAALGTNELLGTTIHAKL